MGVKIHLKSEILSKFYKIFRNFIKYSVILYAKIYIFYLMFFKKKLKSSVKDLGMRKSRKNIGRPKFGIDFFKETQTRTYFTIRYIFFSHLFWKYVETSSQGRQYLKIWEGRRKTEISISQKTNIKTAKSESPLTTTLKYLIVVVGT